MSVFDELGLPDPSARKVAPSSVFSELGLPDPSEDQNATPKATDYLKGIASGVGGLASGVGYLAEAAGADKVGSAIRGVGDTTQQYWNDAMTPAGKRAAESHVFEEDPGSMLPKLGDRWGQALGMGVVQSAPSMLAAAIPGGIAATGLRGIAGLAASRGIGGALAPLAAGTAAPIGGWGANLAGQVAARAPTALGFGAAEGATAGAMNAAQWKSDIEQRPEESLAAMPGYASLAAQIGPEAARKQIAEQGAADIMRNTTLSTGGIGALTGGGALGSAFQRATTGAKGGLIGAISRDAAKEAFQEAPQSAGERLIQNVATRDYIDQNQTISQGVLSDALSGAAIGGVMGGVTGGGSYAISGPLSKAVAAAPGAGVTPSVPVPDAGIGAGSGGISPQVPVSSSGIDQQTPVSTAGIASAAQPQQAPTVMPVPQATQNARGEPGIDLNDMDAFSSWRGALQNTVFTKDMNLAKGLVAQLPPIDENNLETYNYRTAIKFSLSPESIGSFAFEDMPTSDGTPFVQWRRNLERLLSKPKAKPTAAQNAPAAPGSPSPVSAADTPLPAKQAEAAGAPIQPPQGPLPSANKTEVAIPPAQGPEAAALPVAAKPANGIAAALQYPQQVTEGGGPLAQQAADMPLGRFGAHVQQAKKPTQARMPPDAVRALTPTQEQSPVQAKEPWQMSYGEYLNTFDAEGREWEGLRATEHRASVQKAVNEGLMSADAASMEYPDIANEKRRRVAPDRLARIVGKSRGVTDAEIDNSGNNLIQRLSGELKKLFGGKKMTLNEIGSLMGFFGDILSPFDLRMQIGPDINPRGQVEYFGTIRNKVAAVIENSYRDVLYEPNKPANAQQNVSPDIPPAIPAKKATRIASSSGIAGALVTPQQPTFGGAPLEQSPVSIPIGKYGKRAAVTPSQTSAKPVAESLKDIAENADNKKLAEMAANKNPNIRAAASAEVVRREQSGGQVGDYYKALRESTPEQQTALRKALKLKPSANIVTIADRLDGLAASDRKQIFDSVFQAAQAEGKGKADGRESYVDAMAAVAKEMRIGTNADGEYDATDDQFDEIDRRTRERMAGKSPVASRQTPPDAPQQPLSGAGERQAAPPYKKATARSASHYRVRLKTPLGNFDVFVEKNKDSSIDDYKRDAKNAFAADSNMANLSGIAQISFDGNPEPVSDVSEMATVAKNAKWARIAKVEKAATQPQPKPRQQPQPATIMRRDDPSIANFIAGRTPAQLAYIAANGKPGYMEAAQARMAGEVGRAKLNDLRSRMVAGMEARRIQADAQHIDGKDVEAATPAVIKEAVSEGAQNAGLDLRQAHAILLQRIDSAIASAPSEKDSGGNAYVAFKINKDTTDSVPNTKAHLVEYRAKMANLGANVPLLKKIDEAIAAAPQVSDAFVVFEVPGDGKFKITNTKERLDLFRKKIASNAAGFRPVPKRQPYKSPLQKKPQTGAASDETIREMLHSGELTAALELSKVVGRPLVFGTPSDPNGQPLVKTHSEPIAIKGLNLSVGRSVRFKKSEKALWSVTELESGSFIASGTTKADAEKAAAEYMAQKTPEELRGMITKMGERGKGTSQADLESRWLKWAEEEEYRIDNADAIQEKADKERAAREKEATDAWERLTGQKAQQGFLPFSPESNPLSMDNRVISSGYMLAVKNGKGNEFLKYAEGLLDADNQWQKRVIDHIGVIRDLTAGDWSYDGLTGSRNMPRGEFEATTDDGRKITASLEVEGGLASGFVREDKVIKAKIGQDASLTVKQARAQADKEIAALMKPAKKEPAEKTTAFNTEDAGSELTYNRRNRLTRGLKWEDIADKDEALRVKEVTKAKVYPKPDYQALIDGGMTPIDAYMVKLVYDSIAIKPNTRAAPSDADLQRYIDGVNRVMSDAVKWANDNTLSRASLLKSVYPNGWREGEDELRVVGGNKVLAALQPGYAETKRATKDIAAGWPEKQEAWQRQGFSIIGGDDVKAEPAASDYGQRGVVVRFTVQMGTYSRTLKVISVDGTRDTGSPEVRSAIEQGFAEFSGRFVLLDKAKRVVSTHATEEEANEAARALTSRSAKKPTISDKGINVSAAVRTGADRRMPGEDISSDRLRETFKFKGVNFGNWMKGDANAQERQLHLNHAYDSFMDLAEVLDVPPEAMSLNGMLGVAIGAQGSGGFAAAHFVPGVNEINLTRESGAGSLAHEWAHALDHYFARQAGMARATDPFLTEHRGTAPSAGIRPEIVAKFDAIVQAMRKRSATPQEREAKAKKGIADAEVQIGRWLREPLLDRGLTDDAEVAQAVGKIKAGELGDGAIAVSSRSAVRSAVHELAMLVKKKSGKKLSVDTMIGVNAQAERAKYLRDNLSGDAAHVPQQMVQTQYLDDAVKLDDAKGGKKYWSTSLEMFARAFDAFVSDELESKAAKNTYLSHAGRTGATVPKGDERTAISAAIKGLVDAVETKEGEDGNVALFSFAGQQSASAMAAVGASPADAAVFDMAAEGRSAQEILSFLSKASRRPFNRVLAAALSRIGVASTVSIDPAAGWRNNQGRNGAKFAASYSPKTDTVALYTPREAERHVLHEFVHSATLKAIARGGPAARQMQAIFDYVQKTGTMSDQYGMGNFSRFPNETDAQFKKRALDEFTAELFTNPQFQVRLKQLPAPSGSKLKSAWDWIVRVIANLLGLKTRAQETALDRALSVGAALLQENAALTMPAVAGARYHTTWHGSPHKFYTFDLSKIGTGEGAQAYGHGLYVAEAPEVAKSYKVGLSSKYPVSHSGVIEENGQFLAWAKPVDGSDVKVLHTSATKKEAQEALRKYMADKRGAIYKVDLPAEAVARMLDWDAALSNQPPAVQSALKEAGVADVDKWTDAGLKGRELYNRAKRGAPAKLPLNQSDDQSFASARLKQAGISGIRYLDQQSRSGEKATYNFVLFDDKLARIIEVNGVETGVQPWQPGEWEATQGGDRFSQEQPFSGREVAATPLKPGTTTMMVNGVERPALSGAGRHVPSKTLDDVVLARQSAMSESRPYGNPSDSKRISDSLIGRSFSLHGLGGLDVPTQREVLNSVVALRNDKEVVRSVVELIPVDVMNVLRRENGSAESIFNDKTVLKKFLTADGNGSVSAAIDIADALVAGIARVAAKRPIPGWLVPGRLGKGNSAAGANVSDEAHFSTVPQIKATANTGAFSPDDPDIRYSLATNWPTSALPQAKALRDTVVTAMRSDANTSWITPFNTQYHKAEKWAADGKPLFKRVFNIVQQFLGDVSKYAVMAQNAAPTLLHEWRTISDVKAALSGGDLVGRKHRADIAAVAMPLYDGTLYGGGNPMNGIKWSDERLRTKYKLTDRQIKLYHEALAAVNVSMDEMAKSVIAQHAKREKVGFDSGMDIDDMSAGVLSNLEDKKQEIMESVGEIAQESVSAQIADLKEMDRPDEADKLKREFDKAKKDAKADLERLDKTIGDINAIVAKNKALQAAGYFPLMRFGKHTVTARDKDGKVQFFGMYDGIPLVPGSGQAEANRVAAQLKEEFPDWDVKTDIVNDQKYKLYQGVNLDALQLFAEHMEKDDVEPFQEFVRMATNNRSAQRRLLHRKGTPGFDKDVRRTMAQFITSNARATSSNYHTQDMLRAAAEAEADGGDIGAEAIKLVKYVQDPIEEAQALRGFLFFNFLGGSIASAMVNLTQTPAMTLPYLSKFEQAPALMRRTMAAARMAAGKPETIADQNLRHALMRAELDGVTAPQEIHQLMATAANNIFAGSRAANILLRGWGAPFAMAESFNRRIAFITAFKIGEGMGNSIKNKTGFDNAFDFAEDVVKQTQGIYNKGNRMNIGRGAVGATLLTFKQYSVMYLELLKRLPPKQRAIMVGVLLLSAGAGGLPGVDDLEDLWDTVGQWLGYATNSKRSIRNSLTEFAGAPIADVVLNGVLSRMGIDLHSRLGMQNLIPGTGILKQSSTDKGRDIEEFFGPAASVIKSAGDALENMATGRPGKAAMAVSPVAIRNAALGGKMAATGFAQDASGRNTVPVNEAEAFAKGIGFNPKSVAEFGSVKRDLAQDQRLVGVKREEFAAAMADAVLNNDPEARLQAIKDLQEWNQNNPFHRVTITPESIAKRVRDARAEGATRMLRSLPKGMRTQAAEEFRQ